MCKFCEAYEISKEAAAVYLKFPQLFSVALVDHSLVNGTPKGRTVHYMEDGIGYPLRFCPECGRNIEEKDNAESGMIDITTSDNIASGNYPVYAPGFKD